MFKCLYLISFKHGFLQTYSSRWIFWYEQFYVFSITPKTTTVPLDDVVVSHDLLGRIFIILWFTLIAWFWWHRGFCTLRESYRRSISPRRSLSSWSWRVRAESGDLWRTSHIDPQTLEYSVTSIRRVDMMPLSIQVIDCLLFDTLPLSELILYNNINIQLQWASCQIRKIAGCACARNVFPATEGKRSRHASRHVRTHVPWCTPGSLTSGFLWNRWRGEMFPAFPAHSQPAILRIW